MGVSLLVALKKKELSTSKNKVSMYIGGYPYPRKPVPATIGMGFYGYGSRVSSGEGVLGKVQKS